MQQYVTERGLKKHLGEAVAIDTLRKISEFWKNRSYSGTLKRSANGFYVECEQAPLPSVHGQMELPFPAEKFLLSSDQITFRNGRRYSVSIDNKGRSLLNIYI